MHEKKKHLLKKFIKALRSFTCCKKHRFTRNVAIMKPGAHWKIKLSQKATPELPHTSHERQRWEFRLQKWKHRREKLRKYITFNSWLNRQPPIQQIAINLHESQNKNRKLETQGSTVKKRRDNGTLYALFSFLLQQSVKVHTAMEPGRLVWLK